MSANRSRRSGAPPKATIRLAPKQVTPAPAALFSAPRGGMDPARLRARRGMGGFPVEVIVPPHRGALPVAVDRSSPNAGQQIAPALLASAASPVQADPIRPDPRQQTRKTTVRKAKQRPAAARNPVHPAVPNLAEPVAAAIAARASRRTSQPKPRARRARAPAVIALPAIALKAVSMATPGAIALPLPRQSEALIMPSSRAVALYRGDSWLALIGTWFAEHRNRAGRRLKALLPPTRSPPPRAAQSEMERLRAENEMLSHQLATLRGLTQTLPAAKKQRVRRALAPDL